MTKRQLTKRRAIAIVLSFIMIAALGAFGFAPVYAMEAFDTETPITLTARFTGAASSVSGIELKAYKVASMDSNAVFTVDDTFAGYSVDFNSIQDQTTWRSVGETLAAYAERDGIAADYTATTVSGVAEFGTVEPGLYLVTGPAAYTVDRTTYAVSTAMVTAPYLDDADNWVNASAFGPKYTSETEPTPPDNPPENPPTPPENPPEEPPEVPETPGLRVVKIWNDGATDSVTVPDVRPSSIEVELVCEGEIIDTVVLNAANGWQHEWAIESGKTYTVTEKDVPAGYTVAIVRDGDVVSVTNTYVPPENPPEEPEVPPVTPNTPGTPPTTPTTPTTPSVPRLPQTGVPWIPAIILGAVGTLFVTAGTLRRKTA